MQLTQDFKEFIELLIDHKVRFVMVGGWVYNLYAPPRMTGDIDFFIDSSAENETHLRQALCQFGFESQLPPVSEKWLHPEKIIMLGREPCRIDLLCTIDGVTFDEAWNNRRTIDVEGLKIPTLSLKLLKKNKSASGRDKDLIDLKYLSEIEEE